jgi:hypothetical protein
MKTCFICRLIGPSIYSKSCRIVHLFVKYKKMYLYVWILAGVVFSEINFCKVK